MTAVNRKTGSSGREQLVHTAYQLFSQRGFEAVSLADIASEVGLTKQAIIYHFKNKNALYAEVLEDLAARYATIITDVRGQSLDAEARWQYLRNCFLQHAIEWPDDTGLIARELLDNRERAKRSRTWYLRDFLNDCVDIYSATESATAEDLPTRRLVVYREIGAITYLTISEMTLGAIWGTRAVKDMQRVQRQQLG